MFIKRFGIRLIILSLSLVFFCEFLIYYVVLSMCSWPENIVPYEGKEPVKAILLADTHLLGPIRGHWWDKLRREWQMHRSFQTSITLFQPKVVFILGDLFDEGKWVTDSQWSDYVSRFHKLFYTPENVQLFGVVGNHDIGFHYSVHPKLIHRFETEFKTTGVAMHTINDVHFVLVNSVAMQGDNCEFCSEAEEQLQNISRVLKCSRNIGRNCDQIPKMEKYSKPILIQHYPLYRESDAECITHDSPEVENYRELWEVLSQESTDLLGEMLEPRLAFSGHSHNYCHIKNRRLNIEEFTIPSYSWRNRNNPSFALAIFTEKDYEVEMCEMPLESTVILIYEVGFVVAVLISLLTSRSKKKSHLKNT